jgi:DNA-directed RNA polymerase subunit RPC12/RpoP
MAAMKKRLTFKCWNCQKTYSLLREVEGKPKLAVACPYCRKDGTVDLDPYRQDKVELFREDKSEKTNLGSTLQLPKVVPTSPPEDGES